MMIAVSLFLSLLAIILLHNTLRGAATALPVTALFLVSLLFAAFYVVADRFTGTGIDQSVIYHLRIGLGGAGFMGYWPVALLALVCLLLALVASVWAFRFVQHPAGRWRAPRIAAGLLVLSAAYLANPAVDNLVDLYRLHLQSSQARTPSELFTEPGPLRLDAGKNLVVLYLEGVERTYLDEHLFPGLTPALKRLEERALSFSNIEQVWGSHWTIAGMTASQCGVPLVTPSHENSMSGSDRFLPEATCLGDLLKEAGYALHFLGGADIEFAGKGSFYRTHGFDLAEGLHELSASLSNPEYLSDWGLYDDSLYDLAAERFDQLAQRNEPFGLFMLTLDTHAPNGHTPERCEGLRYQDGSNSMLNAVHCADMLAGEFIERIMASPHFQNTLLVVASDHLAMPNPASELLDRGDRRNLLMLIEADQQARMVARPGSILNFAPTLIGRMGGSLPALGYGRDLLADAPTMSEVYEADIDRFLISQHGFLSSLWDFPQLYAGIELAADDQLLLGDRSVKVPSLFLLDARSRVKSVRFEFASPTPLIELLGELPADQRFLWVDHCLTVSALTAQSDLSLNDGYCLAMGVLGSSQLVVHPLHASFRLSFQEIRAVMQGARVEQSQHEARRDRLAFWRRYGTTDARSLRIEMDPESLAGRALIRSSSSPAGKSMIRAAGANEQLHFARGLTLVGFRASGLPVKLAHIDSCGSNETERVRDVVELRGNLGDSIGSHSRDYGAFAVVAHDSARCAEFDMEALFSGTGLVRWSDIGFRQPYVGIIAGNGEIRELLGESGSTLTVEITDFIAP